MTNSTDPAQIAFRMQLRPGTAAEYQRRHDEIWPDLAEALREAGISDYSIFLDAETNALFAVLRSADDDRRAGLAELPVMRRWWDHMADLMEVHSDNRPREWALRSVFRLP